MNSVAAPSAAQRPFWNEYLSNSKFLCYWHRSCATIKGLDRNPLVYSKAKSSIFLLRRHPRHCLLFKLWSSCLLLAKKYRCSAKNVAWLRHTWASFHWVIVFRGSGRRHNGCLRMHLFLESLTLRRERLVYKKQPSPRVLPNVYAISWIWWIGFPYILLYLKDMPLRETYTH